MIQYHCLDPHDLERFLLRRRASLNFPSEMNLAENLVEILRKANEFVPSSAGSILLDNPTAKLADRRRNELYFIASFGSGAAGLMSRSLPAASGIAGHVYVTGRSYFSSDVAGDRHFYSEVDKMTRYQTESLVAIPIRIEKEVCGVLELINRHGAPGYSQLDLDLLEIFAGYISVSIQNVLDARHAQEIAKRDNLTGLYNDRYLHLGLARAIERSREQRRDLAVLFIDLDFFKRVNDAHGHLAGSQVLREVGRLLLAEVADPDAVAARYGGDEFVLVLPALSLAAAVATADATRAHIEQHVFIDGRGDIHPQPLHLSGITCSVGVATLYQHIDEDLPLAETKSSLLRLADTAMYAAKEEGRNRTKIGAEELLHDQRMPLGRTFQSSD
ncbi:MAG TPA: sensor domain-containing diguanylate cyclase [Thermoanaerobaculia bacterium]|nr:sensor domain-containing diguanylate cyclase [Thermoanaerobaculia bacterium]